VSSLRGFGAADVPVAAVATGFPSGQYSLETRLAEIRQAVSAGAAEIDIVINRTLALNHKWEELYQEVQKNAFQIMAFLTLAVRCVK